MQPPTKQNAVMTYTQKEWSNMLATQISIEYHRKPTQGEIRFGCGSIHFLFFPESIIRKKDGKLKKRVKGPDGLIYTV